MADSSNFRKYTGYVAFVDLLGFDFLTRQVADEALAKLDLDWIEDAPPAGPERRYAIAVTSMMGFRGVLRSLEQRDKTVHIAQLSDCAFLWCENAKSFFEAVTDVAHGCHNLALLYRMGVSKGEYYVPHKHDLSLGRFLVGPAVTAAVRMEKSLKGERVAMPESMRTDFVSTGLVTDTQILEAMFAASENPDCFEYRWYLAPWRNGSPFGDQLFRDGAGQPFRDQCAARVISMISSFIKRKEYAWNCLNAEGVGQMVASVVATSLALAAVRGTMLRICDPTVVRNLLTADPSSSERQRLEAFVEDELRKLELGRSLVESEGVVWPKPYVRKGKVGISGS